MITSITSHQFNLNINRFHEVLVHHLVSRGQQLQLLNHYVKSVPQLDKKYVFLKLHHETNVVDVLVSYDDLYSVPVCYFNLYEGSDEQLVKSKPPESSKIAMDSHPLTGEVWSFIHPCETLEGMKAFAVEAESELQYLVIWFGVYGLPSVLPHISLRVNLLEYTEPTK